MAPWVAVVEAWLVQKLLRSPSFHRAVGRVHKGVHRMRHGPLEEDLGGTNIDKQGPGFMNHFWDEIRDQAGRSKRVQNPSRSQQRPAPESKRNDPASEPQQPNSGFVSHFLDELRSQARGGDKNR